MSRALVTGASGFIGAYLVRRLVTLGWNVVALDNLTRGLANRLDEVAGDIEVVAADVRDADAVARAARGCDVVFHLAAVNGTDNFYQRPQLVLDVGVRGVLAVVDGARAAGVPDLVVASSAEVYQAPPHVPTSENVPLMLPDSINPRYSYGGSKILTELVAFNYYREYFRKVQAFRPHNVYGPDMGWKHVIPQLMLRAMDAIEEQPEGVINFAIQGDGSETRAFAYVDDVVEGIITMYAKGDHRRVYHIGNDEETSITRLVGDIGHLMGRELRIVPGDSAQGGATRRCPDIGAMRALGYAPAVGLIDGLARSLDYYRAHRSAPSNALL